MIETSESLRFAAETREALGTGRYVRRQHFDRDGAIQFGIVRAVDLVHSARAENRLVFVVNFLTELRRIGPAAKR
jgi:hypothetical protein